MDDFNNALAALGEKPDAASSGIPPGYLRSTVSQESGGNPNAVSPKGARGLMQVMPKTNIDPGYGVTPARDNSEQERTRVGQDYLAAMHNHYKDPAIASIAYNMGPGATDKWLQGGGQFHKLPAETRDYVGAVMTGAAVNNRQDSALQQRQSNQSQPTTQDADFASAINALSSKPAVQEVAQVPTAKPNAAPGVPLSQYIASTVPLPGVKLALMAAQKYLPESMNPTVDTSSIKDAGKHLGAIAVALGDTVENSVSGLIKHIDYAGRRAVGQSPEQATKQSNEGIGSFFENPASKFFNSVGKLVTGTDPKIEESAAYKGEASQIVMKFVGENIGKGAKWIADKTGVPTTDVENMMNTVLMGVTPAVGKGIGKAGSSVVRSIENANQELSGFKPLSGILKAGEAPTVEPSKPRLKLSTDGTVSTVAPIENPKISAAVRTGWNTDVPQGSVGAAGTSLDSRFSQASPKMQAAYKAAKKDGPIDPVAAERHLAADSLNAGVELMPGQSTGNIHLISDENNLRAKRQDYADRFNAQNEGLKNKLTSIQDEVAPDVYSTGPTSSAEKVMSAYQVKDAGLKKDISANYQALKDANGGHFPMSTKEFLENTDATLKKNLKTAFVPKEIASQLEDFRNGATMNVEQFESLRTNLSNEIRKAERSGDGNAVYASVIVRNALENIPLTPEAAHLKPLADKARSSAASRFDLLKKDPAYKATISESISADKFIEKYVINGSKKDIQTMRENLSHDPVAQQQMAHATVDWLKRKGGLVDGNGTLSQAGYNKNLMAIHEKLADLVGPEAAITLRTVGDVARYTQAQPKGSYVNNSGTLVAALKNNVIGTAENMANAAAPFFNLGTSIRNKIESRAIAQSTKKTLETGAGLVKLKDIGK